MASENLVNDLFEIVQSNTKEKLSYYDFEKDLLKSINLPNDEIDRALSIMLSQAQVNPNVIGESKGGTFMVSPSFSASVISTIKYENQFIEGKVEFENRKNQVTEIQDLTAGMIIMTDELINKMIDSYQSLSSSERDKLWCSYSQMSDEEKDALQDAHDNMLKDLYENPNVTPKQQEELGQSRKVNTQRKQRTRRIRKQMDPDDRESLKEDLQSFKEKNPEVYEEYFAKFGPIETLTDEQLIEVDEIFTVVLSLYQKRKTEEIREQLGQVQNNNGVRSQEQANPYYAIKFGQKKDQPFIIDMVSKSGKSVMFKSDHIFQIGSAVEEISANKTFIATQEKQVKLLAKLDAIFDKMNIDDAKRIELMGILRQAIESISPKAIEESFGDIEGLLLNEIQKLTSENESILTLTGLLKEHSNLVSAIGENRNLVLSKIIAPYMQAKENGKSVKELLTQNYTSLGIDMIDNALYTYNNFFTQVDIGLYEPEELSSAFEENKRILSNRDLSNRYLRRTQRTIIPTFVSAGKPIREDEYEAGKLPKEDLMVDEIGLQSKLSGKREVYDLSFLDGQSDVEWGMDFGGFDDYLARPKVPVEEKESPTEPIQEDKEIQEESHEVSNTEETTFESFSKTTATGTHSDRSNGSLSDMNMSKFFNPRSKIGKGSPIRKMRMAAVVAEADLIREAIQIVEQRKAEDKESNYEEEIGE